MALSAVYASGKNGDQFAQFGGTQHEDGTKDTYPILLNVRQQTPPPPARTTPSKNIDLVAHWYNDFGLS